jgi:hypothetical protein
VGLGRKLSSGAPQVLVRHCYFFIFHQNLNHSFDFEESRKSLLKSHITFT